MSPTRQAVRRHATSVMVAAPLLLAVLTPGCASYEVAPVVIEDVAEALRTRPLEPDPDPPPLALDRAWFPLAQRVDISNGLDLAEACALALRYAPGVLEARAAERVHAAEYSIAGVPENPTLGLSTRLTEGLEDLIVEASLGLVWALSDRRNAAVDVAEHALDASRERVAQTELETLLDVRSTFVEIAALRESVAALEALSGSTDRAAQALALRAAAGEATPLRTYALALALDDLAATREDQQAELAAAEAGLLARIGVLPGRVGIDVTSVDPFLVPPDSGDTTSARIHARPDVRAAAADLRAAESAVRRAVEERTPELVAGPEFETEGGDSNAGLGFEIELPVFRDGSAAVAAARAERDAARARLDARLLTARSEQQAARSELATALRAFERYSERVAGPSRAAQSALQLRLDAGEADGIDAALLLGELGDALRRGAALRARVARARLGLAAATGALASPSSPTDSTPDPQAGAR